MHRIAFSPQFDQLVWTVVSTHSALTLFLACHRQNGFIFHTSMFRFQLATTGELFIVLVSIQLLFLIIFIVLRR